MWKDKKKRTRVVNFQDYRIISNEFYKNFTNIICQCLNCTICSDKTPYFFSNLFDSQHVDTTIINV